MSQTPTTPQVDVRVAVRVAVRAAVLAAALLGGVDRAAAGDTLEGMPGPYGERLRYGADGLSLTFPAQDAELQIGGRLHLDAGAAGQSRRDLPEAFPDAVAVRRAWIEPTLTVGKAADGLGTRPFSVDTVIGRFQLYW